MWLYNNEWLLEFIRVKEISFNYQPTRERESVYKCSICLSVVVFVLPTRAIINNNLGKCYRCCWSRLLYNNRHMNDNKDSVITNNNCYPATSDDQWSWRWRPLLVSDNGKILLLLVGLAMVSTDITTNQPNPLIYPYWPFPFLPV